MKKVFLTTCLILFTQTITTVPILHTSTALQGFIGRIEQSDKTRNYTFSQSTKAIMKGSKLLQHNLAPLQHGFAMQKLVRGSLLLQRQAAMLLQSYNKEKQARQKSVCYTPGQETQQSESDTCPYTINLMWINKNLDKKQRYIFPESRSINYVSNIIKWASLNPQSSVNLWFDGKLTPESAVKNTAALISEHLQDDSPISISLRNIWQLPHVKNNPDVFSDKTPVYFRADLLRVIAGFEAHSAEKCPFVYTDFDVEPLPKNELFDPTTKEILQQYGMVMGKPDFRQYENSFYILGTHNPNMLTALKLTLIDLNIQRARNALNGNFYTVNERKSPNPLKEITQIIYDSYPPMFKYFYQLEGLGYIEVPYWDSNNNYCPKKYDYQENGLTPFNLDNRTLSSSFDFVTIDKELLKKAHYRSTIWIPVKPIKAPEASLNYD